MASDDRAIIESLLRISQKLNSTLDLNALMDDLVSEAISLVNAESGVSGLYTTAGMVCHKYFQRGMPLLLEYCWPPGHGLPGWLITHKAPYLTNDASTDLQIVRELCVRFGVHSALSTPILNARGELLGFFEIHNKRDDAGFTEVDKERLMAVSHMAANSIQNALAFQEVNWAKEIQSRLAAIVDSSNDAIVGKTLKGIITSWNKGAEKIFGYTAEEAIGQPVTMLIPTNLQNEEDQILKKLARGERIEHYETVRRRKDGTRINISLTISPIKGANGQIIGASKIARDITEHKQARMQIEEEREALETINQVSQMLSAELDLERLVQTLTDAATEITGAQFGSFFYNVLDERGASYLLYTLSGVPREHFAHFPMPRATDLFGPTFRGENVICIDDVKKDPRYGKNSPYYGMPKGHLPVTSYLAAPVISRSGEVLGGLFFGHSEPGIFTGRHERILKGLAGQAAIAMDNARLFESARKARKEAEMANRLKDEFLATVSHELRTPLNAILGWSRVLRSGKLDEQSAARALETIERSARAQGQIIEDILDVSRIITGKLRLDVSPVEISPAIEAAIDSLRPTAEARGIRLESVLDSGPNPVLGDSNRLQQIIWNLLSNAIKFTPKGGRVQIALERINSYLEVTVSDTGQGINREFLPYVFERFRQADSSTTRLHGGLGLGLAIVRHLVELHGGSVTAHSPGENLGSTFIVRFPLAIMREGGNQWDEQNSSRFHQTPEGAFSTEFGSELTGVRVLVVDDEADARELLSVILQQCGAEVRAASSTQKALQELKEWKPNILVSDIGMPEHDGYELIKEVRALESEHGGDIPAIALTAYARSEDRLKALRSGFQTHLSKPIEPAELVAIIASLTRSSERSK